MDIDSIIDQLKSIVASSARVPGTQRRIVEKGQLEAVVEQLQEAIPSELREAKEILRQRDSIINQATLEAQRIRSSVQEETEVIRSATEEEVIALRATAETEYDTRVSDAEVFKQAEKKADEASTGAQRSAEIVIQDAERRAQRLLSEAEALVESRRSGADQYAREVLFSLEERISDLLSQVRKGIDVLEETSPTPG